jgi:RecB family exonuclease
MKIPREPQPTAFASFSPTLYSSYLKCKAQAIWRHSTQSKEIPESPHAILGQCFHGVLESAKRPVTGDHESAKKHFRTIFDTKARECLQKAHEFNRRKFGSFEELPFYYLTRERAVRLALASVVFGDHVEPDHDIVSRNFVEKSLRSKDQLMQGRADFIDREKGQVIDYKSGDPTKLHADELSENEQLQLKFYASLAIDNDIEIAQGVIVRADGKTLAMDFDNASLEDFANTVKRDLSTFNSEIAQATTFQQFANAGPEVCSNCPCIPVCDEFWKNAKPEWVEHCGVNFEGVIDEVTEHKSQLYGDVVNLKMVQTKSTLEATDVHMNNIPRNWLTDSIEPISAGTKVRVVKARSLDPKQELTELKFDKAFTTCWLGE